MRRRSPDRIPTVPLRIAMLATRYSPPHVRGGEEAVVHELKRELERRGHLVRVFTPAFGKWRDLDALSDAEGVTRISVRDVPFFYHFQFARKLRRHLTGKRFDLVLNTHHTLGHRLAVGPHVVVVPTTNLGEADTMARRGLAGWLDRLVRRTVARRTERRIYERCDHIIAVNDHIAQELQTRYDVPGGKISVIGNGVDCERFSPPPQGRRERGGEPVVLYVGRLVGRKNVPLLLRAAALLRDRNVACRLRLCGDGPARGELEALAGELALGQGAEFLGRVPADTVPEHYRRADVFVLPSRYEGMPMVLLEAQATGLPAVVARFQGAENVIRDGVNGYILSEDAPEALADRLTELLASPGRREEMGAQARQIMVDQFSWQRIVDEYLALCDTLG